ncbi:MAG TPA: NfeD family protein, partial [Candidatus Cloacimonadota bacterium]|nr:NfeD family protein [Candidatus Cloacimonadota bacterium]
MGAFSPWMYWVAAGIICVIIEIFYPAFFFLSIGIAAIITGILASHHLISNFIVLQIIIFGVVSIITFLSMKKLGKKVISGPSKPTNVYALVGQTGIVTTNIPASGRGHVKLGGEEWSAISQTGEP